MQGQIISALDGEGKVRGSIDEREVQRFATVDTAGTSAQKAAERKGKPASWSVCQIWDYWPKEKFLFLRHQWRERVAWEGLKSGVQRTIDEWKPKRVLIENAHHGPPLKAELRGSNVELISTCPGNTKGESGKPGKLERATKLLNMLEQGRVFLPQTNTTWVSDVEAEWLSWTGMDDETSDQVDAAAYAARHCENGTNGAWAIIDARDLVGGHYDLWPNFGITTRRRWYGAHPG